MVGTRQAADAATKPVDEPEEVKHTWPVRVDPTINFGHCGIILTTMIAAAGWISADSTAKAEYRKELSQLVTVVSTMAPKLEAASKANDVQDERIGYLSSAAVEFRRGQAEVLATLVTIREDLAMVKAKLSVEPRR